MIRFNCPPTLPKSLEYIKQAFESGNTCGDGEFTKKCSSWIEKTTGTTKALLTTSCTHALEMAALLLEIKPGDEVIMPAFTFVSTADAFVLRGAKIIFVDIRPDTMNIDENLIENAITNNGIVVSNEFHKEKIIRSIKGIKIPTVCEMLGVKCLTLPQFLWELRNE